MKGFAYAKINLTLEILSKEGKYHTIASIFQKINLYDAISIKVGSEDKIYFTEPIRKSTSTVHRAVELFREETSINKKLEISIEKHIPMGAGLGGGSSDAATTLILLNTLFDNPLSPDKLIEIGAEVGKDVPFFLKDISTALVTHFGEIVTKIPTLKELCFVLVHPPFHHKTEEMYQMFDIFGAFSNGTKTQNLMEIIKGENYDADEIEMFLYNDFEVMLLNVDSDFIKFKNIVEKSTGKNFHLTGSGSTIFCVCSTEDGASEIASKLRKIHFNVNVAKTIK
jgi:4-diphosphocytidyl-2-C-methyl-D-erythritol kinase